MALPSRLPTDARIPTKPTLATAGRVWEVVQRLTGAMQDTLAGLHGRRVNRTLVLAPTTELPAPFSVAGGVLYPGLVQTTSADVADWVPLYNGQPLTEPTALPLTAGLLCVELSILPSVPMDYDMVSVPSIGWTTGDRAVIKFTLSSGVSPQINVRGLSSTAGTVLVPIASIADTGLVTQISTGNISIFVQGAQVGVSFF